MTSKLVQIYKCLCDETRLRILNLLSHARLCVADLQYLLEINQVKASKHLAYLKKRKMVNHDKSENRVIYSLPKDACLELEANIKCLQDCIQEQSIFKQDLEKLRLFLLKNEQSKVKL